MSTWSYARVSHRNSVDGFSLPAQDDTERAYHSALELPGWGPHGTFGIREGHFIDKAVSAYKVKFGDRQEGSRLLEVVRDGDHVLFYSMCRGFRRLGDWYETIENWMSRGITAHFIKNGLRVDGAASWFSAGIFALYSEWKAKIISERIRVGREMKRLGLVARPQDIPSIASAERGPVNVGQRLAAILTPPKKTIVLPRAGRIHSYVRCSDVEQVATGISPAHQIGVCERFGKTITIRDGSVPGNQYIDLAVSAWKKHFHQRPEGRRLLADLQPGDHVVVSRVDRVFRNMNDMVITAAKIEEKGAFLHIADGGYSTDNPNGRMIIGVLTVIAEFESSQISEMTKDAMAARRAGGILDTLPPYVRRERIEGLEMLTVDELRVSQLEQVRDLAPRAKSVYQLADALEEIDAARFGDRVIPFSGYASRVARRLLHDDHGWTNKGFRRRIWTERYCDAIREPGYFDRMDQVIEELEG